MNRERGYGGSIGRETDSTLEALIGSMPEEFILSCPNGESVAEEAYSDLNEYEPRSIAFKDAEDYFRAAYRREKREAL